MNILYAFIIGGAICVVGQLLIDFTALTPAKILVSFVVIGVVLTAVGVYGPFVKLAGSGATVPLTGFGYALAEGVKDAVAANGLQGAISGGIAAASAGITAALCFSYIASLVTRSKDKN